MKKDDGSHYEERGDPGMSDEHESGHDEPFKPDWLDVIAFTIAAFEILAPIVAALLGVVLFVYLLLKLLAH